MSERPATRPVEAEALARAFHAAYEDLAPTFGYQTRTESAVPWHRVPEANRLLMIATAAQVIAQLGLRTTGTLRTVATTDEETG